MRGKKRHVLVDTQGTIIKFKVHVANIVGQNGVKETLCGVTAKSGRLAWIWTDGGYTGPLVEWAKAEYGIDLEWIRPPENTRGFQLVKKRWVAERTFSWLDHYRRLSKN